MLLEPWANGKYRSPLKAGHVGTRMWVSERIGMGYCREQNGRGSLWGEEVTGFKKYIPNVGAA